jgi:hypothetical protein
LSAPLIRIQRQLTDYPRAFGGRDASGLATRFKC